MKAILPVIFALILVPYLVSGETCLDYEDIISIQQIENELNLTNQTLFKLFESRCRNSITQSNIDNMLNNTNEKIDLINEYVSVALNAVDQDEINKIVDNRVNNYTEYWTKQARLNDMLLAIYNNTRTEEKNSTEDIETVIDTKFNDLEDWIIDRFEQKGAMPATGRVTSQQDNTMYFFGAFIVIIIVVVVFRGPIEERLRGKGAVNAPHQPSRHMMEFNESPRYNLKTDNVQGDLSQQDSTEFSRVKLEEQLEKAEKEAIVKRRIQQMEETKGDVAKIKKLKKAWEEEDSVKEKMKEDIDD